jgi:DNA-binding response OmpR family regulator
LPINRPRPGRRRAGMDLAKGGVSRFCGKLPLPCGLVPARTGHRDFFPSAQVMMKRRILLADDDESVRKMVGRVLESENYEVLFARTGSEAMDQALQGCPELVLLDIGMQDRDGWEAFKLIDRMLPGVPVILMTARPNQHEQALRVGAEVFMEKPLDLAALLKIIHDLLERADLQRSQTSRDR